MREFFTYGSVRRAARKGRSLPRLMAEKQAALSGLNRFVLQSNAARKRGRDAFVRSIATISSRRCVESYAMEVPTVWLDDLFGPNDNADRPR